MRETSSHKKVPCHYAAGLSSPGNPAGLALQGVRTIPNFIPAATATCLAGAQARGFRPSCPAAGYEGAERFRSTSSRRRLCPHRRPALFVVLPNPI